MILDLKGENLIFEGEAVPDGQFGLFEICSYLGGGCYEGGAVPVDFYGNVNFVTIDLRKRLYGLFRDVQRAGRQNKSIEKPGQPSKNNILSKD